MIPDPAFKASKTTRKMYKGGLSQQLAHHNYDDEEFDRYLSAMSDSNAEEESHTMLSTKERERKLGKVRASTQAGKASTASATYSGLTEAALMQHTCSSVGRPFVNNYPRVAPAVAGSVEAASKPAFTPLTHRAQIPVKESFFFQKNQTTKTKSSRLTQPLPTMHKRGLWLSTQSISYDHGSR